MRLYLVYICLYNGRIHAEERELSEQPVDPARFPARLKRKTDRGGRRNEDYDDAARLITGVL